jgi:SET domain-containing protein
MSQDCILPLSWRSLKTEVRQSPIHGHGLFAIEEIGKDEIVAVKGGHIITRAQLADINSRLGPVEIQVDDSLFVAPVTSEERDGSMLYSNHSCDPNLGVRGSIVFVAMRDISAGEELTHDWCMTDNDTYEIGCKCGSLICRGMLRGNDWQKRELQDRYADYFSDYLKRKIIAAGNRSA